MISFISNFSYLGDPSFVVMRQRYLAEFDKLWFDCMNGDSRETGKLTPEGKPDPSVFSTDYNREGIRVGTAISVIVRKENREKKPVVRFRNFWGVKKRDELLASLARKRFHAAYALAEPGEENRYSFRPGNVSAEYKTWPRLPELSHKPPFNGPVERRAGALVSIDRQALQRRMIAYFDGSVSDEEVRELYASLMMTGNRIVGPEARRKILKEHRFDPQMIVKYPFKVFDVRWCYLDNLRPLFSEPSPDLLSHRTEHNGFFITRDTADKSPEGPPFYFSPCVCDYDCISGHARHFPILLVPMGKDNRKTSGQNALFAATPTPNLSRAALAFLAALKIKDPDGDSELAGLVWMHALAIGYSPAYLTENADGIRRDWPRIPLPDSRKRLEGSAALGRRVAALLDTESEVPGVTAGKIEPLLRTVGVLCRAGGGALDPDAGDLAVTAGWGHAGKGSVTMPAKGRIIDREYDKPERETLAAAAEARGLSHDQALALLGPTTRDVYLNERAYWRNVPVNVWEYLIGGYQVLKKWLSYREEELLGRALRPEEARKVTNMARRLAAIVLLQPALDANYRSVKTATYAWPADAQGQK